jgi:hypothetical protein
MHCCESLYNKRQDLRAIRNAVDDVARGMVGLMQRIVSQLGGPAHHTLRWDRRTRTCSGTASIDMPRAERKRHVVDHARSAAPGCARADERGGMASARAAGGLLQSV